MHTPHRIHSWQHFAKESLYTKNRKSCLALWMAMLISFIGCPWIYDGLAVVLRGGGERFCSLRQIRISFLINFQWSKINHQKDIPNGTTWTQNIITGFSSKTIIINSERFTPLSAYKADVCYLNSILQYFFLHWTLLWHIWRDVCLSIFT